ncbi:hypothetical protein T440DRAFT_257696 [Plenodomus tracheiphilus IPT5]|uniref:Uncharacterized protein n=1 Tax=Plenodomus tracheiphilus IPT5 TaxID=1408161 RepID=A0A6A7AR50_9PLEO|nr:hypothetical protein T440DRAFT_257696 [Plenodomus tracheiphilus IPT5]
MTIPSCPLIRASISHRVAQITRQSIPDARTTEFHISPRSSAFRITDTDSAELQRQGQLSRPSGAESRDRASRSRGAVWCSCSSRVVIGCECLKRARVDAWGHVSDRQTARLAARFCGRQELAAVGAVDQVISPTWRLLATREVCLGERCCCTLQWAARR